MLILFILSLIFFIIILCYRYYTYNEEFVNYYKCLKYNPNNVTSDILTSNNITRSNDISSDIYIPCGYTYIERELLKYNTMSVALSARTDISVGTLINLELPSVRPGEDTVEQKFQGGNHLITQIKWTLNRNELRTNLKVVKKAGPMKKTTQSDNFFWFAQTWCQTHSDTL